MEELEVRSLVKGWHQRTRREADLISRFVFLWFCFNAWLTYESEEDTDREMIKWLAGPRASASQLRASFDLASKSDVFVGYLKALAGLSPISSTGRRRREVRIDSPEDFSGIVESVYQVRCNLFHGGKRASDLRDQKLVMVCARILEKWVGNLVAGWR
jgi:hypothetical protein